MDLNWNSVGKLLCASYSAKNRIQMVLMMVYNTETHQWLRLALSKGPNKVGVPLSSPEGGKSSSFRNVVFSGYLQFRTMDKVLKPSDSEFSKNNYRMIVLIQKPRLVCATFTFCMNVCFWFWNMSVNVDYQQSVCKRNRYPGFTRV
jgi:hypothetical protein